MRAFYVRLQPQSLRMSQFQLVLLAEASRVCGIFDAIRFPTQLESISTNHSPHVARYRDQVTEYGLVKRVQPGPSTRARTTGRSAFRAIDPPFCSYTRRAPCRSDRPRLGLRLRKDKVPVCGLPSLPTYLCRAARLTPGTYATTYLHLPVPMDADHRCSFTKLPILLSLFCRSVRTVVRRVASLSSTTTGPNIWGAVFMGAKTDNFANGEGVDWPGRKHVDASPG